jgi:aspartate racemase
MSPESTAVYYEHITRTSARRYGEHCYPEILIWSVNFRQYVEWQRNGSWRDAAGGMADALERLRAAGADFGLIATNTMHIVFEEVQRRVGMPLLSIVDATAEAVRRSGIQTAGLLGTVFTMREEFFRQGLLKAGIRTLVPEERDQTRVNDIIYRELCRGEIRTESRESFLDIIQGLRERGAQGIVLGCTEIPLLVRPEDCDVPLFNTTTLHAEKALDYAVLP